MVHDLTLCGMPDALQVLSDAQERSWYDSHRDEILRGGDGQGFVPWRQCQSCVPGLRVPDQPSASVFMVVGGAEDPDAYVVNVWPFFSGSAYR